MRRAVVVLLGVLGTGCVLRADAQPTILWTRFDPLVIPSGFTGQVRYEVKLQGTPSKVVLVLNARDGSTSERLLRDDGTAGDRVRADGVYTATVAGVEITSLLQPDDVLRAWVGYLDLYTGTTRVTRLNVFADVLTPEVERLPVVRLAQDAQRTDYLVNFVVPSFITGQGSDFGPVTRRFYELFPDEFDFLCLIAVPGYPANRTHVAVKNAVAGIGLSLFDRSRAFGSAGRLLGVSVFPLPTMFDGADQAYLHELGHQWINFLPCAPLSQGSPHWPLSDLASGVMGWSLGSSRQGGEFPFVVTPVPGGAKVAWREGPPLFTDLDLYLMGLLPPSEVATHHVFPPEVRFDDLVALAQRGEPWRGALTEVRIADVVRCVGPRIPSSSESERQFRVATVIVSMDGLLSADAMAFYSHFARRAEARELLHGHVGFAKGPSAPFYVATRGLGSLSARIVP